jgi:6-phosphogluconate dehydrogenase
MDNADKGLIGLGVMGQNLELNMNNHGIKLVVFNRSVSSADDFLNNSAKGTRAIGTHSLEVFVSVLIKPRRAMLMIQAGKPVDDFIELLSPYLEPGGVIIDDGNSNYNGTIRRNRYLESNGLSYLGTGVSGGGEGAR